MRLRFGGMMTFFGLLLFRNFWMFGSFRASSSSFFVSFSSLDGKLNLARSLPLIWTTISTVSLLKNFSS